MLTLVSKSSSKRIIHAVVLAAGTSSRFGTNKLVVSFRDKPLLQHALLAAQGACEGLVNLVVGHNRDAVIASAGSMADRIVINTNFENGIGSSIAAGVRSVGNNADAVLIVLGDQPLLTAPQLNRLIAAWSGSPNEIIASNYENVSGPPVLFPRDTFDQLERLTDDSGARQLLSDRRFRLKTLPIPEAGIDVDTRADLESL